MRYPLMSTLTTALLLASAVVCAESKPTVNIPEKVSASILKRHPDAQELQGSQENHFGAKLLEVSFKKTDGEVVQELFTQQGHLFTNELPIATQSEVPNAVLDVVKAAFPRFEFKKAEVIANPNGAGEEYEVYLNAESTDWRIAIDSKGAIVEKQRY